MALAMIYGATGYTGSLASERAKVAGVDIILAGRQSTKLEALAANLQLPWRAFGLDDPLTIQTSLRDVSVVLNCAGPFADTAMPLAEACIEKGIHYLDVSAELSTYLAIEELDQKAVSAHVTLLPGSGGIVAMLGCLASKAAARIDDSVSIDIAVHVSGTLSNGSVASANSAVIVDCMRLSEGRLVKQDADETMSFDFGDGRGPTSCLPVTLPDLFTIWKTTGVANIRTYVNVSGDSFLAGEKDSGALGPPEEERERNPYHAAVIVHGSKGEEVHGELHTINGYTFTALASIEAVRLVLAGKVLPGLQTPATAFGADFVDRIDHTHVRLTRVANEPCVGNA
ncbi:hypothetical protein M409DRAFT_59071 [Zasmidium cellare ATCC 36951]|uniref:Saccharopine dehydrogenase NADP binding domain-containing protein n=1 Tax=Zasmidium cellare ATCC 36951 TaxID=1080233 RepID=A0A6A6C342_ZASCE|nr:uncharacterized protein M409DRAFT_59071 [Zasmidium cellare ATCC 36951]KAF2161353.1 hypothetical protein M409DRAFT_59071 [Zasmidium cellare ATCC 36951]